MKKIIALVMGIAFAFGTAGFAAAQTAAPAPKTEEMKKDGDKKDAKTEKKDTKKKAAKTEKKDAAKKDDKMEKKPEEKK